MLVFDGAGGLIVLAVWIFCFIDVVVTPETQCRNLPKLAWVFVVLLLPLLGSVAWLVAGHPWDKSGNGFVSTRSSSRWSDPVAEAKRPTAGRRVPGNPDDDEEFLAGLRRRADEQRRRAAAKEQDPDEDKS